MFAENIIQAALEQVKTTRGNQLTFSSENNKTTSENIDVFVLDFTTVYVNGTSVQKVAFNTRYVAGANFLGKKEIESFA